MSLKDPQRGMSKLILEGGGEIEVPVQTECPTTFTFPFHNDKQSRSPQRLTKELKEIRANSTSELAKTLGLTIRGQVRDADGEERQVSIPVTDETSFDESGLTDGDPTMRTMYITYRTGESVATHCADRNIDGLTSDQAAHFEAILENLRAANKGGQ